MAADKKSVQQLIDANRDLNTHYERQAATTSGILNSTKKQAAISEQIANNERTIAELKKRVAQGDKEAVKAIQQIETEQRKLIANQKRHNTQLKIAKTLRQELNSQLKIGLRYLMDSDKVIKSTILSLGMSGSKADLMRGSFEASQRHVAHLGGSLSDTAAIMQGFADGTGKARVMTESMVRDVAEIGFGTALGIEAATKLGAQFEFMGLDARATNEYVQGVIDTTERMGVNTTKVLKNVNDNFKKLSTFTFQKGVKGMMEMAVSAEKTRVSMETALNVAEATRGLDEVIELGANLQIMGGEFAKMDPFEWLYTARNEPDKLNEKISEMTTGMYTFKKNSEGIMEKFISPADRDRLTSVAKSLGIANEEMFEIAQKRLDLNKINQDMAGLGLTGREKELIEGAAFFDSKSGKYQVELAGKMRDITSLTKEQAAAFEIEQVSLKKRAEEAMTFEKAFKSTIEELKSALLPLLKQINGMLSWSREHISPLIEKLTTGDRAWLKVAGALLLAGTVWKGVAILLGGATVGLKSVVASKVAGGGLASAIPATGKGSSGLAQMRAGKGIGAAKTGVGAARAGTGVAAAGIGVGIMLAAKGIGEMAEKMAILDGTQIWALPATVLAMSVSFFALAPAITAAGAAGSVGAVGLLAIGAAMVGIGFGVNLAAKGIGIMAEGLGIMLEKSKGSGKDMLMVGGGIAAIAGSLALFSNPITGVGMLAFVGVMAAVTVASLAAGRTASAMEKMGVAMKGSKEDWIAVQNAVESISNANFKGGGALNELANLLKQPLKVEFTDKQVAIVSNITMELDGDVIFNKTYNPKVAVSKNQEAKDGQSSGGIT